MFYQIKSFFPNGGLGFYEYKSDVELQPGTFVLHNALEKRMFGIVQRKTNRNYQYYKEVIPISEQQFKLECSLIGMSKEAVNTLIHEANSLSERETPNDRDNEPDIFDVLSNSEDDDDIFDAFI